MRKIKGFPLFPSCAATDRRCNRCHAGCPAGLMVTIWPPVAIPLAAGAFVFRGRDRRPVGEPTAGRRPIGQVWRGNVVSVVRFRLTKICVKRFFDHTTLSGPERQSTASRSSLLGCWVRLVLMALWAVQYGLPASLGVSQNRQGRPSLSGQQHGTTRPYFGAGAAAGFGGATNTGLGGGGRGGGSGITIGSLVAGALRLGNGARVTGGTRGWPGCGGGRVVLSGHLFLIGDGLAGQSSRCALPITAFLDTPSRRPISAVEWPSSQSARARSVSFSVQSVMAKPSCTGTAPACRTRRDWSGRLAPPPLLRWSGRSTPADTRPGTRRSAPPAGRARQAPSRRRT